jgi:polar amino acid transport system permease protein
MSGNPPGAPSEAEHAGPWERLALASARVPFALKVTLVWLGVFAFLVLFFSVARFDTDWMRDHASYISGGIRYTMSIALGGIILAIFLALLGALARISSNSIAYGISGFYVSFFRGTPLIVQMFLIYLALPQVGRNLVDQVSWIPHQLEDWTVLEAATAGTIALGLNYGAYMTEIFRAGIQSVESGQGEAADALGMTYRQKMRRVVLPQAFRVIIPPTGNEFIAMMKDTALVSFLGALPASAEIFRRAQLSGNRDFKNLEALILAALMYWGLTVIFTFLQRRLEARMSRGYVRTAAGRGAGGRRHSTAPDDLGGSTGRPHGHGGGG